MKLNIPKLAGSQQYQWHIRVQRWLYGGRRLRRKPYRVIASTEREAVDKLVKRFHKKRGLVVTKISQGRAV